MEFLTYLVDFILHIDAHLFELVEQYGMWIYAILFIIVFCETGLVVTPFLPGDSLLFASGVVAGAGLMGYGHVLLVLLAAGVMGDAVNYFIGRHVGPAIFQRDSRFIKKEHLLKAHHFYEKHGGKADVHADAAFLLPEAQGAETGIVAVIGQGRDGDEQAEQGHDDGGTDRHGTSRDGERGGGSRKRGQGCCRCCATGMAGIQGKGFQSKSLPRCTWNF